MSVDLSDVPMELRQPVAAALAACEIRDGHLAVELVGEERIRELNREHRGKDAPTDVLAFPLDGAGPTAGPLEFNLERNGVEVSGAMTISRLPVR